MLTVTSSLVGYRAELWHAFALFILVWGKHSLSRSNPIREWSYCVCVSAFLRPIPVGAILLVSARVNEVSGGPLFSFFSG